MVAWERGGRRSSSRHHRPTQLTMANGELSREHRVKPKPHCTPHTQSWQRSAPGGAARTFWEPE